MLAACLWAGRADAQVADPHLRWHTIESEHFAVHFHAPLARLAREVVGLAERAHVRLNESLGFAPEGRTQIVLTDLTDSANGVATVLPRSVIRLYAAAPGDMATIGDYDDWLALLVTHEHTHIHHLSEFGGIPAFINLIFGRTYAPNQAQPGWFIEGLATYEESRLTSAGRLRSSITEMYMRADALEGRVLDLAQLSNDPVRWPHGDIRYLYGAYFVDHIARRYGQQALHTVGTHYGRQPLPFGLNRMALRATGRTFSQLYEDFQAELHARFAAQAAAIRARGLIAGEMLLPPRELLRSPRFLPDGRLAYSARDGVTTTQIRTLAVPAGDAPATTAHLQRVRGSATYVSPHPDGQHVVFNMDAPHRDIYVFDDLFSLDLAAGELTRLTHGLRAREPDVAPDGRHVVFVTQAAGTAQLERARLDDVEGSREVLFRGAEHDQVFTPRVSPDGRRVVFSAWRRGGYRDILMHELSTGRTLALTHDRAQDTGPVFSRDGRLVLFSSDRDGVHNLYAFELSTGLVRRVTNVLGGAFQPEPTPDGHAVVYVSYASRGFGLHRVPLPEAMPLAEPFEDLRPAPSPPPPAESAAAYPVQPYDPWPTLLPANYELNVQPGALGTEVSLATYGQDVADFHFYSLSLRVAVERELPAVSAGYSYRRLPIRPSVNVFHALERRSDLQVGGESRPWLARDTGATLGLSYRFPSIFGSHSIGASYTLSHVEQAAPFGGRLDPTDPPPRLPHLGVIPRVNFSLSYADLRRQAYDVGYSEGQAASLQLRVTDPVLGRDIRSVRLRWELEQYVPMPFARNHVLALYYTGGQSGGDPGRLSRFNVGGYPSTSPFSTLPDLVLEGAIPNTPGTALRGFEPGFRTGSQMHLALAEYRFPIMWVDWGVSTLPFYVRRIYGAVFGNAGNAFEGRLKLPDFAAGAGAELFIQLELAYRLNMTLRLGAAQGLTEGGQTQAYFNVGTLF